MIAAGSLIEFALNEGSFSFPVGLHYWHREQKTSTAEVDYVIQVGSDILPIEVKAGKTGRLKSIQVFLTEKKSPLGIRISEKELGLENNLLSVPFYLISHLPELVNSITEHQGKIST